MTKRLEQKIEKLEQELSRAKENERLLESIISVMPGNVYWKDCEGHYLGCNDNILKMHHLKTRSQIIGKTYEDLIEINLAKEIRARDAEIIRQNTAKTLEEVSEDQQVYLTNKVPLHDPKGRVLGILGISFNITERKRAEEELKKAKEEAEAANARIKAMAGSIAHELRTPLGAVGMNIGAVDSALNDPTEESLSFAREILGAMRKEIESANTVINMLLMNIREDVNWQKEKRETCSVNQCIEEALDRYPFLEGQKEKVTWKKSEDFTFQGNALFMQHVIFNLLKNALYQIDSEGKGIIEIWTEQTKEAFELHFKDTAKGIPADILPRLFEKFFTSTKKGTGLGLAFCKMVVEAFGGTISCCSEEGNYTEFAVRFSQAKM